MVHTPFSPLGSVIIVALSRKSKLQLIRGKKGGQTLLDISKKWEDEKGLFHQSPIVCGGY